MQRINEIFSIHKFLQVNALTSLNGYQKAIMNYTTDEQLSLKFGKLLHNNNSCIWWCKQQTNSLRLNHNSCNT